MAWSRPEIIRVARERIDSSSCWISSHRHNTIQMSSKPCVASKKKRPTQRHYSHQKQRILTWNLQTDHVMFHCGSQLAVNSVFFRVQQPFFMSKFWHFPRIHRSRFLWLCPSKTIGFPMIFSFQRFPTSSHGGDGLHIGFFCGQPLGRRIHGTRPWERHSAPAINFRGFSVLLSPQTLRQNAGGSLESDE